MHIVFVHTPMSALPLAERKDFWRNFDIQYHSAHPGLRHMKNNLWELPHWMHWLGGVLVEAGFTSLAALDFYTSGVPLKGIDQGRVQEALRNHPADVYLFSPMTPNLPFAYEIADAIKLLYKDSKVVFGGVVASPLHTEVAGHPSVDYVVFDRGEYALPALLRALQQGGDLGPVGNLSYKHNGTVVTNPLKYPHMPVARIPFPKVDLFQRSIGDDLRYLRQVYGLGCPYKCSFCTIQTIGHKADYFPIDRVLAEIAAYRAHYGEHHNIYWGDEVFTLHRRHCMSLCQALELHGGIRYDCQTRLNLLDDDRLLSALYKSGCRWVEIGLETADQESQDIFKQRMKLDRIEEILQRVRDAGLAACAFMVNGFPNQTVDDMKYSVQWTCSLIERDLLQATYFFGLVPYPGSEMYEQPEKYNMKIRHNDFRYYHEDMLPVFESPLAAVDEVYEQFICGVRELGQAMSKRPYFGTRPPAEKLAHYGTFWRSAHV